MRYLSILHPVLLALGAAILLTGCAVAAIQDILEEEARDTERLLAAAGFELKLADTPQKMAHLKTLAQNSLVMHDADGQPRYVYADTAGCKCLYAGGQAAYDKYQRMVAREDAELK